VGWGINKSLVAPTVYMLLFSSAPTGAIVDKMGLQRQSVLYFLINCRSKFVIYRYVP